MKRSSLLAAFFVAVSCLAFSPDVKAQVVDGYTSIDYDEYSNLVTAYSETYVDYDLMYDYQAYVYLTVTDPYGVVKASSSARDTYNSGFVAVTVQFSGEADTTYTAKGAHKAYAQLYNYDWDYGYYPYRRTYFYYDYWWYGFYEGQGIYRPWYYSWFTNGFREVTRRSRLIPLGTTYDYASVTTPGELTVAMSAAQTIKDGETATFSVTTGGGTPTNYEWIARWPSRAGNSPGVTFSPASGSNSVTTNGHWFASPNAECGASFDARYTIKCTVTFSNGKKKSAETTLTVNAYWNPAGAVASPTIQGGPETGFDQSRGLWVVVGPGTLNRVVSQPIMNVPTTSQFYNKTSQHELKHTQQWDTGMFSDLLQVADLMTRLSPLTGTTREELSTKLANESTAWFNEGEAIYNSRKNAAEIEAHAVSDPIAPRYLYQRCGRTEF